MAAKVEVILNAEQIRTAFDQLPKTEKLRLVEAFERATWSDRFGQLVQRIRRRARKYPPLSDGEIVRICREVRQDLYDLTKRRRRH